MPAHEPGDVHTMFFDAFNARDVETLASLYEDEALLVMPGGNTLAGIDTIRKALEMGCGQWAFLQTREPSGAPVGRYCGAGLQVDGDRYRGRRH